MKTIIATVILVLGFGALPADAAQRQERVRVQVNTEKRAPKSRLNIRFVELIEDSRCPADTNCIWAGNARIKVRVSKNGRSHEMTLDTNGKDRSGVAEGYSIKLTGLTPIPRSNIRINRNGYVATFEIVKLSR